MTHEEKKTAKIVEELTMFLFALDATYIDSRIEKKENETVISLEADYSPAHAEKLASLEHYLNSEKNDSMEDIYWELAGSGTPGESSQLLLIGMMIDSAEVSVEEKRITIKLRKKTTT